MAAWYAFENLFWDLEATPCLFKNFDLHLVESSCRTRPVNARIRALDIHWAIWNLRESSVNIVYDIEAIIEGRPNLHVFTGSMMFECYKKASFNYVPFPESVYCRYFCLNGMIKNGWLGKRAKKKILSDDN